MVMTRPYLTVRSCQRQSKSHASETPTLSSSLLRYQPLAFKLATDEIDNAFDKRLRAGLIRNGKLGMASSEKHYFANPSKMAMTI